MGLTTHGSNEVQGEFAGVEFEDQRLAKRLTKVVEAVSAAPSKGFPQITASSAELEALYRFLKNERVNWRVLLEPHLRASALRCQKAGAAVMVHDTTQFAFGGDSRTGKVGHLSHGHPGFFGHFALAVSADGENVPFGIVAAQTFRREEGKKAPAIGQDRRPFEAKESFRWVALAEEASGVVGGVSLVHVMDREADDYLLLSALIEGEHHFVIRASGDRQVLEEAKYHLPLSRALRRVDDTLFRQVSAGARKEAR
jgi:hypothetical protein